MWSTRVCGTLIASVIAVTDTGAAAACSSSVGWQGSTPADGATDVPTNIRLRLDAVGTWYPYYVGAELQDAAGDPVAVTFTEEQRGSEQVDIVLTPDSELAPHATYSLRGCVGYVDPSGCTEREWSTVATFETGSEADTSAPRFDGASGLSIGAFEEDVDSSCAPSALYPLRFTAALGPLGTDDHFVLYRQSEVGLEFVALGADHYSLTSWDGANPLQRPGANLGPGLYVLRLRDIAGNTDENLTLVEVPELSAPGSGGDEGLDDGASGCVTARDLDGTLLTVLIAMILGSMTRRRDRGARRR